MEYDRKRGNILLSRKMVLEEERERQKKEILAQIEEGIIMEGTVKHITNYGLFVDLGGVDGLVHISNISWLKIRHPSQTHRVGDKVTVKVLDVDKERERISLGIKQLEPDPWERIEQQYPVGTVIEGRINNITEFGLFIGMDEGIDGLVHISDISWGKLSKHPSEIYKKGDVVQAVVLRIDPDNERISLGIKQITPDPWEEVPEKYKPGTLVSGRLVRTTSFGLFVEIEEGVEGLIHSSELPQAKRGDLAAYNPGDAVKAEVIDISKERRQIDLSMRNIEKDTWKVSTNLGKLFKEEMGDGTALDSCR
jgi:small subunit ribosomal protein S1